MSENSKAIQDIAARVPPVDSAAAAAAEARMNGLGPAPGALGRLVALAGRLAGAIGSPNPDIHSKAFFVMAGDHGVAAQRLDIEPAEAATRAAASILAGESAVNAALRLHGLEPEVVDFGLVEELPDHPRLTKIRVAAGARNLIDQPAMRVGEMEKALAAGVDLANRAIDSGAHIIGIGRLGVGAACPACTIAALWSSIPLEEIVNPAGGLNADGLYRKRHMAGKPMFYYDLTTSDPVGVIQHVMGFEMTGLVGFILQCAARRTPVVLDGYASLACAQVAAALSPHCAGRVFCASLSDERGHRVLCDLLGVEPILDLGLTNGEEGVAAALGLGALDAVAALLSSARTREESGIPPPREDLWIPLNDRADATVG